MYLKKFQHIFKNGQRISIFFNLYMENVQRVLNIVNMYSEMKQERKNRKNKKIHMKKV